MQNLTSGREAGSPVFLEPVQDSRDMDGWPWIHSLISIPMELSGLRGCSPIPSSLVFLSDTERSIFLQGCVRVDVTL